jgi:hypothetical protein
MQTVTIRDRREPVDHLPLIRDQAHLNPFTTKIQTNVQHEHSSFPDSGDGRISPAHRVPSYRWSALCFGWPAARVQPRAPTYAVRYGGPTSSATRLPSLRERGGPPSSHSRAATTLTVPRQLLAQVKQAPRPDHRLEPVRRRPRPGCVSGKAGRRADVLPAGVGGPTRLFASAFSCGDGAREVGVLRPVVGNAALRVVRPRCFSDVDVQAGSSGPRVRRPVRC